MRTQNKIKIQKTYLNEKYPYTQIDSDKIKTTKTMTYKQAKEDADVEDLSNKKRFKKYLSYVKIIALVVITIVILGSIFAMYIIAIAQFVGFSINNTIDMAGLIPDTGLIFVGAIFGLFIKEIFK